jgi:catechol 2,3-dioxygenase-like lactoylglutathione lyase family enzyme
MPQHLASVSYLVRDYDEAIAWFTGVLGFVLVEDTPLAPGKRWVLVAPPGTENQPQATRLLLARAASPAQLAALGAQAGGRVAFFLHTDDFARDHARYLAAGVRFREAPRHEPYGTVAVFEDLHGQPWDLIELHR